MILQAGSKVFVLKYNENYIPNAMELHKDKCKEVGNCWYGKAGKRPAMNKLRDFLGDGINMIFYNKKHTYICRLLDVSEFKPDEGYPEYYNDSMWKPNSWYLITELMQIDKNILEKLVVLSSGKRMSDTINSSMTSFYFTELVDSVDVNGGSDA